MFLSSVIQAYGGPINHKNRDYVFVVAENLLGPSFHFMCFNCHFKKKKDLMGEQVPFKYDLRAHEAQEIINFQLLRLTSANIFGNLICLRKLWRAW